MSEQNLFFEEWSVVLLDPLEAYLVYCTSTTYFFDIKKLAWHYNDPSVSLCR